jgi:hypothetical protein
MSADANQKPNFDFITDAEFRDALESDYRELSVCMTQSAWKSVHVLAGSIVEAILADYLIGTAYPGKAGGKDPLKMELGPIISACKDQKIITERTADLSSVVRSYRNLIHPGRVIRLAETVDQKSASIAKALVEVIAEEVAATKAASYGFTAEQIVNKLAKDRSAFALLSHFLKETNDRERERLVKDVLPMRYFQEDYGDHGDFEPVASLSPSDYSKCHRRAFDTLSPESKAVVAKKFIKILKEESGDYITQYENLFFKAEDMEYMLPPEVELTKAHLLGRLRDDVNEASLGVLQGIGAYLTKYEMSGVVDIYARAVGPGKPRGVRDQGGRLLTLLYYDTDDLDVRNAIERRVDEWINHFATKDASEAKVKLEEIKLSWTEEIPF